MKRNFQMSHCRWRAAFPLGRLKHLLWQANQIWAFPGRIRSDPRHAHSLANISSISDTFVPAGSSSPQTSTSSPRCPTSSSFPQSAISQHLSPSIFHLLFTSPKYSSKRREKGEGPFCVCVWEWGVKKWVKESECLRQECWDNGFIWRDCDEVLEGKIPLDGWMSYVSLFISVPSLKPREHWTLCL